MRSSATRDSIRVNLQISISKRGGYRAGDELWNCRRRAGMAAIDDRLVPSSQAKLDELFLHWLSLPEAQQYVLSLLANARKGKPLVQVIADGSAISPIADERGGLSPKNRGGIASPPPRSPTERRSPKHAPEGVLANPMWVDGGQAGGAAGARDGEGRHGEDAEMADRQAPAVRKPTPVAAHIPRFYTPRQPSKDAMDSALKEVELVGLFMLHIRSLVTLAADRSPRRSTPSSRPTPAGSIRTNLSPLQPQCAATRASLRRRCLKSCCCPDRRS
jgi:hypothetical protein